MITSNEQQEMLQSLILRSGNYFEQARTMQALCAECRYTQASLSKLLNVSQSYVGNKIRLLQYSAAEQALLLEYGLTERHARALLHVSPQKREKLITTAGKMRLTVHQTEEMIEKFDTVAPSTPSAAPQQLSAAQFMVQTQDAAQRLRALGYKTTCLSESGEGWHRITITIVD
jgi:ParB family chromosome partitioning protein